MPVALRYDPDYGFDLAVEDGAFATDEELETAITISLFTDKRASESELAEAGYSKDDARGFWGDSYPDVEGDQLGSKLWLLDRAKRTDDTLRRAERYALESLEWMKDDRVASRITATAQWFRGTGYMTLAIEVSRPGDVEPRWRRIWNAFTGEPIAEAA